MIFQMLLVGAATIGVGYYRATMDKRFYKPYLKKWEDLMRNMKIKNEELCVYQAVTSQECN